MFIFYFLLYLFIGYTYVCWISYREGAGFDVNDFATDAVDQAWGIVMIGWPILATLHISFNIHDKYKLDRRLFNKISPRSFYNRGKDDNDIHKQAEKHLLGGGK